MRDLFYHDCTPEDVTYAAARLCKQPIAPQSAPLSLGARFSSLLKACIRAADDRTIPPEYQIEMTEGWPATQVYDMQTSHSPFFADPGGLAAHLDTIAGRL